jgi:hypothetical protein
MPAKPASPPPQPVPPQKPIGPKPPPRTAYRLDDRDQRVMKHALKRSTRLVAKADG